MKIRWTAEAVSTLEHIGFRIAADNPEAAFKTVSTIYERIHELVDFPSRGRKGKRPGTRELVFSPLPYIAVYRTRESTIEILHIWHGAQKRRKI